MQRPIPVETGLRKHAAGNGGWGTHGGARDDRENLRPLEVARRVQRRRPALAPLIIVGLDVGRVGGADDEGWVGGAARRGVARLSQKVLDHFEFVLGEGTAQGKSEPVCPRPRDGTVSTNNGQKERQTRSPRDPKGWAAPESAARWTIGSDHWSWAGRRGAGASRRSARPRATLTRRRAGGQRRRRRAPQGRYPCPDDHC